MKSGITLIALVVTIVILLILAGVSISFILDNNGIIQKSKEARREYGQAKANEHEDLSDLSDTIDEATGKVAKIDVNTKAIRNGTINGEEGNSGNPTIPKGYIPIDTTTSIWGDGNTAPSQNSVDHGLVIKDDKDNEWVWIPVPDVTVMCDILGTTEYMLCGTTGDTGIKTKLYSRTMTIGKDSNIRTMTRATPGISTLGSYREPDLVVGNDSASYDAVDTNYKTILGDAGTKEQLAQLLVDEYKEMIESVRKYKGFYIGRYELSGTVTDPTEKPGVTLTKTNWYYMYNACRSSKLQASDKVKTQMIWGCQWDAACNFVANKGDQKNITDSREWGNYKNSTGKAAVTVTENGTITNKYGSKQNTGYSEYWKANNIYDLAGNCEEWTQETNCVNSRIYRGGDISTDGLNYPALIRRSNYPNINNYNDVRFSSCFNNKVALKLRA